MCNDCGCGDPEILPLELQTKILSENDHVAAHNRSHFDETGVVAINLMGSPGAGKTALLEATAACKGATSWRLAAMSGDLATENDGQRLMNAGIDAATITTGTACHLDARLVHRRLHDLEWRSADYLFIENVGNLVCPAIYDLGQHRNVVVISVTEGEDKPLKYPVIFKDADAVVITKVDLLPALPHMNLSTLTENIAKVMPDPRVLLVSAFGTPGVQAWVDWLDGVRSDELERRRVALAQGTTVVEPTAPERNPRNHLS